MKIHQINNETHIYHYQHYLNQQNMYWKGEYIAIVTIILHSSNVDKTFSMSTTSIVHALT